MYPILFSYGPFIVPSWHIALVIAAILSLKSAIYLDLLLGQSFGQKPIRRAFLWVYLGGLVGARAFNILVDREPFDGPMDFLRLMVEPGGMLFYGSVALGTFAGAFYFALRSLDLRHAIDIGFCSMLLGIAIGRVGCFLNGDDYGKTLEGLGPGAAPPWWAVSLSNFGDSAARYPIQLFESLICLALWLIAIKALRSYPQLFRTRPGFLGSLALLSYAIQRFFVEYYRGDERGYFLSSTYSTSQGLSLILLALSLGFVMKFSKGLSSSL